MSARSGGNVPDLPVLLAGADQTELSRTVLAVAAMHEPGADGRCRYCRPGRTRRLWWRRPAAECPTRRVIIAELRTRTGPHWTSA
ncbi:MAG TPA: hypothetical protein VFX70_20090 [Mycobacteriales bacterium]|nr:hypothetical protein [Mycobacteriales bacterium]